MTARRKRFATWKNQVSLQQALTLDEAVVEAVARTELVRASPEKRLSPSWPAPDASSGCSERRLCLGEAGDMIARKLEIACNHRLAPILCAVRMSE